MHWTWPTEAPALANDHSTGHSVLWGALLSVLLIGVGLHIGAGLQEAKAQGTIRTVVSNVPPVLQSPYVSDIEQNVRQGRYAVQVIYSSAGGEPVTVRLRISLSLEGEEVLETTSRPVTYEPGTYTYRTFEELPEVTFEESVSDLVEQARAELGTEVGRSGVLPEGEYTLRVEPQLLDPAAAVSPLPGTAVTTVRFPQPPELISPVAESRVSVEQPVFSWTPVNGAQGDLFEYDLLIARVLPQQTPLQAIEANRLVTGQRPISLTGRTSFSYTPDLPPLEEGATYAWQVRVRETNQRIPVADDGESEIHTFTYGTPEEQGEALAEVSEIPLVPGFARLRELGELEVREEEGALVLNGEAALSLSFAGQAGPTTTIAEVRGLRVQASDPSVLMGGQVRGAASEDLLPDLRAEGAALAPRSVRWRMGEGMTLEAQLTGSEGEPLGNPGRLRLTPQGPRGTLTATGSPIARFSSGPMTVRVRQVQARFPEGTLQASGVLSAFGRQTDCQIDPLSLGEGQPAVVNCAASASLTTGDAAPGDSTAAVQLELQGLEGAVEARWGRDSLSYDLTAEVAAQARVANTEPCGARATLRITPGGTSLLGSRPSCPVPTPRMDLGVADLLIEQIRLETLRYRGREDGWSVSLAAAAAGYLPTFGGAALPVMEEVRLTPAGARLPAVSYKEPDLAHLQPFTTDGVQVRLTGASAPEATVSIRGASSPGKEAKIEEVRARWPLSLDLGLTFPGFGESAPECLQAASAQISGADVGREAPVADIPPSVFERCRQQLPPGPSALAIGRLGGRLETDASGDSTRLDPTLSLGARLKAGAPVTCEDSASISLGDGLRLGAAEDPLEARAGPIETSCRLAIGPLEAGMSDVRVALRPSEGRQGAFLTGTATVQIGEGRSVEGPFRLNLRTGEFAELDIRVEEPFVTEIPRGESGLTFRVPGARLTPNGFVTDGRGELLLPETTIGATFESLRLGLKARSVEGGQVLIDRPFGFDARVDTSSRAGMEVALRAVGGPEEASPEAASGSPGVYFGLSGTPQVDSTGLSVRGETEPAAAGLSLPEISQTDGLEAVLSDSFEAQLLPLGLTGGRVTIQREDGGAALAHLDRSGLHLTPLMAQGTIPAKLPLPSRRVAYLRLKDAQGNLLVQTSRQRGGRVRIEARPGRSPQLVLPAFQQGGTVPRLPVALNQFTIDAAKGTYDSGSLSAQVPQGHPLRGRPVGKLPLALRAVEYGSRQVGGAPQEALFLSGGLRLFGQALKAGQPRHQVTFYVESGARAKAQVGLQNLGAQVPVAGGGKVTLSVDAVQGTATVPLRGGGGPAFDFQVEGGFGLYSGGGGPAGGEAVAAADVTLAYARPQGASGPRLSVSSLRARSLRSPDSIGVGSYKVAVPKLKDLSLSYDAAKESFSFDAGVEVGLAFDLQGEGDFALPLRHVRLSDRGFEIPPQSVNASSVPGLSLPRVPIGPAEVKVLALRTGAKTRFDWFGGGRLSLAPKLDLAVFLPSFGPANVGPPQGITLSDVTFSGGALSGSSAYAPSAPKRLPIGPPGGAGPALSVSEIRAELSGRPSGAQALSLDLTASLLPESGPLQVPQGQQCPAPKTFQVSVVEGPGLEGTVQDAAPCGQLSWGPVGLKLTQAKLTFAFQNGTQRLRALGAVEASLPGAGPNASPITVRGTNVGVDLLAGRVTSGSVEIDAPFGLPVPLGASNPLLRFTVGSPAGARPVATLGANGLALGQVSGTLDLESGRSVGVDFNGLRFSLGAGQGDGGQGLPIDRGSATIDPDVALQATASPLDWSLVDPSTSFGGSAGARLSLGSPITLSKDGLSFSGGGTAQARLQGQQFASLDLSFENGFTIGTRPVAISGGRANLSRPQSSSPLIWFDEQGLHANLGTVAKAAVPDTLGLPSTGVAYLVLRDPSTGDLRVNASQAQGGTQIQSQSGGVDLVLAGLGGPSPPRTNVSFGAVIDDAGNVSARSLELSLSGLSLGPEYPFTLTKARYRPGRPVPFEVEAEVDLPEVLQAGTSLTVDLALGPGGFEGRARTGTYSKLHRTALENQAPVAEVQQPSGADPKFTAKVRGLDIQFGSDPSQHAYRLSGDFQTPLLSTSASGGNSPGGGGSGGSEPVLLHFSGTYSAQSQSWSLTGTANHVQGDLPMGVGTFDPNPTNGIVVTASGSELSATLNGVYSASDFLEGFEVTVQDLTVGVERPNQQAQLLASVGSATISQEQSLSLFGGAVGLTVNRLSLGLKQSPLAVTATVSDGTLSFLRPKEPMQLSGLTIGSDGTFSAGSVKTGDLQVLGKHLVLKQLAFSQSGGSKPIGLSGTAEAQLPQPLGATADANISVESGAGGGVDVSVQGPNFNFDRGKHKIGNNPATEVDFGEFATFDLTGVGLDLNVEQSNRTPALRAAASLYLNNNTSKRVDFGDAGNLQKHPGIAVGLKGQPGSYRPDVQFNARAKASPENPLFTFDMDFLAVSLEQLGVSAGGAGPLELTIGGSAEIDIKAVYGDAAYKGLTITKNGIESSGQFRGGSFGILPSDPNAQDPDPIVKLELGFFQRGTNQRLPSAIDTYSGNMRDVPDQSQKKEIQPKVRRYFWFANQRGSALNLTIGAGKGPTVGGGIEEVLFFRTMSGEVELQVVGVNFQMEGAANVEATVKYTNVGSGFGLQVIGNASIGGKLDSEGGGGVGGTLVGVIENAPNRKLRVGMFLAARGGIPIVPGIIDIKSAGIGFFLRARDKTVNRAENAVQLSDEPIIQSRRSSIRTRNKTFFTVKVFGGVGVIGGGGSYVFEGSALVTVTNSYALVDQSVQDGSLLPIPGGIESANVLGVNWKTGSVSGAFYQGLSVSPGMNLVDASMGGAFFARSPDEWALYTAGTGFSNVQGSGVDVDVLGGILTADGDLVLCSDGFYIDAKTEVAIPKEGIVQVTAGWEMALWGIPNRSNMGAYAEVWAKIEAGPATVGTEVKGAYIQDGGDHLIYAYGAVHVVIGKVAGHVAIRDDGADVGLGKNEKYEEMIAKMRSRAKMMGEKASEARSKAQQLKKAALVPSPSAVGTPAEDLAKAGYAAYTDKWIRARSDLFGFIDKQNQKQGKPRWEIYKLMKQATNGPLGKGVADTSKMRQAWQDMKRELTRLRAAAQEVQSRLQEAESQLRGLVIKQQRRARSFSTPVQSAQISPVTDGNGTVTQLPGFQISGAQAQRNTGQLTDAKRRREQLDRKYRKALSAALADLQTFDRVASGKTIVDYRALGRDLNLGQNLNLGQIRPSGPSSPPPAARSAEGSETGRELRQGPRPPRPAARAGEHPTSQTGRLTNERVDSRSIADVGEQYRRAITAVNENYARRLDNYRARSSEADRLLTRELVRFSSSGTPGNGSNVRGELAGLYSTPQNNQEFAKAKSRIEKRYTLVDELVGKQNPGSRWNKGQFRWRSGGLTEETKKKLRQLWVESGMEVWWDMHKKGLQAYRDSTRQQARRVANRYRQRIGPLKDAHVGFTETVDQFYALKADLTTTAYGLAKEYVEWRRAQGDSGAGEKYKQTLKSLVASLEPPKIQNITAQSSHQGYFSRVQIQWSAVPQSNQGRVSEVSYDINLSRYSQRRSLENARFRTVGGKGTASMTFYAFSLADQLSGTAPMNRRFDMALRVRGEGGNTAARTAQFAAPVQPGGGGPGVGGGPSGSIETKDRTPPTKPTVSPRNMRNRPKGIVGGVYPYAGNSGQRQVQSYWSPDSSRVSLVVESRDPESDVTKIEYAVGSRPMQGRRTDRQGWTQVPGTRITDGQNQSGVNWKQRITIRDLDLSGTDPTYISLRTANGEGLTSDVNTIGAPFYYDSTPPIVDPSEPRVRSYSQRPDPRQSPKFQETRAPATQKAPGWKSPRASEVGTKDQVTLELGVSVRDPESEALAPDLRVLSRKVGPETAFNRSSVCPQGCGYWERRTSEFSIDWSDTGRGLEDTLYAYVRSENLVEKTTVAEVAISPSDGSRPTTPTVQVRPRSKGATLYLTQEAADPESGIAGYRYAVGTSPRGTSVRDFPESGVDFTDEVNFQVGRSQFSLPPSTREPKSISIPKGHLPSGKEYYVSAMAINGKGRASRVATTGPAAYDSTPPLKPSITAGYVPGSVPSGPRMRFEAQGLGDPQSGLQGNEVHWELKPLLDPSRSIQAGTLSKRGLGTGTFSESRSVPMPAETPDVYRALGFRVALSMENGAGMTRTAKSPGYLIGTEDWGDSRENWPRLARELYEDGGLAPTRLVEIRQALGQYQEADRTWLISRLEAATSSRRRALLNNLSTLLGPRAWEEESRTSWREAASKLLDAGVPVARLAKARQRLAGLPQEARETILGRLSGAQTTAERKRILKSILSGP
jgi:hypothetical protein